MIASAVRDWTGSLPLLLAMIGDARRRTQSATPKPQHLVMHEQGEKEAITQHQNGDVHQDKGKEKEGLGQDNHTNGEKEELRGRIIVYSISGCPHCKATKTLLKEHHLPFFEVNLDVYPERRSEMVERTKGARTVPQIFFNEVRNAILSFILFLFVFCFVFVFIQFRNT